MPATTGNFLRRDGARDRQDDLSAVRVAGQHQRHLQCRRFRQPPRIVCQQDHEAGRAAGDRGDVAGALGPEANADESIASSPDRQARSRVLEHLDTVALPGRPACRGRRHGCRGRRTRRVGAERPASAFRRRLDVLAGRPR